MRNHYIVFKRSGLKQLLTYAAIQKKIIPGLILKIVDPDAEDFFSVWLRSRIYDLDFYGSDDTLLWRRFHLYSNRVDTIGGLQPCIAVQ